MNIKDAFNLLGIESGQVTPEDIKQAYRRAALKYHPDKNPAGLEMMQAINAAYEAVKDFKGEIFEEGNNKDYGDQINTALNAIIDLGLTVEVCGAWVWVTGNTRPHKEILKQAGFFWAAKKLAWYFRPNDAKSYHGRGASSLEEIREKYGSHAVNSRGDARKKAFLATAKV